VDEDDDTEEEESMVHTNGKENEDIDEEEKGKEEENKPAVVDGVETPGDVELSKTAPEEIAADDSEVS
jgi:hypothetical protein